MVCHRFCPQALAEALKVNKTLTNIGLEGNHYHSTDEAWCLAQGSWLQWRICCICSLYILSHWRGLVLGTGVCGSKFRKGGSNEGFVAFVIINLQPELRLRLVSQGWATSSRAPAASGRFQLTLHFECFNLNPVILVSSMQLRKRRPKLQVTWEIGESKKLTDIPSRCRFVSRQVSWATFALIGVCHLFLAWNFWTKQSTTL